MKYGCCLNMVAGKPDKTGAEWLPAAKRSGFDYVELPLAEMMALSASDYEQLRSMLQQSSISCQVCNNFFPKTLRLTGPNAATAEAVRYAHAALTRAAELGVSVVVFGSGGAKQVPDGFSLESGYEQVAELLRQLAPIAQEKGITIAIEPLRKAECNLINTFREGCHLAADVSSPSVRVLIDFYHMTIEQESPNVLLELGPQYLAHVHFANPNGRVYPLHADEARYQPFMQALQQIGYDGRISCEAYTNHFAAAAPLALNLLRSLNQQGHEKLDSIPL